MPAIITVIGAGNMGTALISGLLDHQYPADCIQASDPQPEKLSALQKKYGIQAFTNNKDAVAQADVIILAVKPQQLAKVVQDFASTLNNTGPRPLIISIAAGIPLKKLESQLPGFPIIRAMPNTPALVRTGATALFANANCSANHRAQAETLLGAVGITVWLEDESHMDAVTALSGSGPAYFFLLMESLQKAAETLGLPADAARVLTLQTALGAAQLALTSSNTAEELRQQVTSPGGTTEAALKVLEKENFRGLMLQALTEAKKRSQELAQ